MDQKYKLFQWCPVKQEVVPIEQVERVSSTKASHNFISDEMPPTRNPLNPKEIFTSKSKLRAVYKAAGVEEIGTAYENGYSPEKESQSREKKMLQNMFNNFRERLNG